MPTAKAVRADLVNRFGAEGLGEAGQDLIDDYLALLAVKNALFEDIRTRGVILRWKNGPEAFGYKPNPFLPVLRQTLRRMAHMRRALGLIPDSNGNTRDPEEEL